MNSAPTSQYNPSSADSSFEYANSLFDLGYLEEAEAYFNKAVALNPQLTAAWYNLGNCQMKQSNFESAILSFETAITSQTDLLEAHFNLGICLEASGRTEEAIKQYRRVVKLHPDFILGRQHLAELLSRGELTEAELGLLQIGNHYFSQLNYQKAIETYCKLLAKRPDCAAAQNNLGVALERLGKYEGGRDCYAYAVELDPDNADYVLNLGAAYQQLGEIESAMECYRYGELISPDNPDFANNIGALFQLRNQPAVAESYHRKALEKNSHHAGALTNLGNALMMQLKVEESSECYRKALEIIPHYPPTHLNLGMSLLLNGDYCEGWKEYEYRETERPDICCPDHPRWDGSPLPGKTLLAYAEGGFGDTIMFTRYLTLVKQRANCRVLLECKPELHSLLKKNGIGEYFELYRPGEHSFDSQVSLFSLPAIFETSIISIPSEVPYIHADAQLCENWRVKLQVGSKFRVGLKWTGNPMHRNDINRSCPLEIFHPLTLLKDIEIFSLEKSPEAHLGDTMQKYHIRDLSKELTSFDQTAAAIACLDLIISVDTSAAHLAGAMGLPAWTLLPYLPDWRWMLTRADSPWYPTMKLFRQKQPGDWDSVVQQVIGEIVNFKQLAA